MPKLNDFAKLFALVLPLLFAPQAITQTESWFVMETADGDQIGYSQQTITPTPDGRQIISRQSLNVRAPDVGGRTEISQSVREESDTGQLLKYSSAKGEVLLENRLATLRPANLSATAREIRLGEDVLTGGELQVIKAWDFATNPKLAYRVFNPSNFEVETIEIHKTKYDQAHEDAALSYARIRYIDGHFSGASLYEWSGNDALLALKQRLFDVVVRWRPSNESEALSAKDYINFVRAFRIASPYRIPSSARKGRVRYTFERPDWFDIELAQTPEQQVQSTPTSFILDICEDCSSTRQPDWDPNLSLGATEWMQSDAPELQSFVRNLVSEGLTETETMHRLVRRGQQRMRAVRFDTHLSALEAFRQREGDCVESALLLAALGRAAGIPTRISTGLVYSRERYHGTANSFMPHAWVMAYTDGEWRSFDMALDGFDATHIAFLVGDGEPWQLAATNEIAGWLSLSGMNEVRARPE